ncbi:MAG: restriction endonuclease [Syntrophomonadaceae bacterium]|nr:restriction endonuclease [Syntrophomonadaceae bacterium]
MDTLIAAARKEYHKRLLTSILTVNDKGIPSNADKDSKMSVKIAKGITDLLQTEIGDRLAGQTSGNKFEEINTQFLCDTFLSLNHLRPGDWEIKQVGNRNRMEIAKFEQYAHLVELMEASKKNPELAAALGNDYTITPDIIIIRNLIGDEEINKNIQIVDNKICLKSALRAFNGGKPLLHANVSSKWTIRSDRSQNSRSEALNLIRNRKGHLPHIVVVTAEPLPSRLASIALGTGDIDCVYHFALDELVLAVKATNSEDSIELLDIMISGKRLKDISDLPLDLAV